MEISTVEKADNLIMILRLLTNMQLLTTIEYR